MFSAGPAIVFFRVFTQNNRLNRYGPAECNILTVVLEQNEDISDSPSYASRRTSTNYKKIYFLCNNKCIGDNSTYNEGGIGLFEMDRTIEHFYKNDKNKKLLL